MRLEPPAVESLPRLPLEQRPGEKIGRRSPYRPAAQALARLLAGVLARTLCWRMDPERERRRRYDLQGWIRCRYAPRIERERAAQQRSGEPWRSRQRQVHGDRIDDDRIDPDLDVGRIDLDLDRIDVDRIDLDLDRIDLDRIEFHRVDIDHSTRPRCDLDLDLDRGLLASFAST